MKSDFWLEITSEFGLEITDKRPEIRYGVKPVFKPESKLEIIYSWS